MALSHSPSIATSGLVFHLDAANTRSYSGSGIAANSLSSGIGGTLMNGIGFSSSSNGFFSFDGTNDYLDFGYNSSINNATQLTIECWYKSSNIGVEVVLFNTNTYGITSPAYGYHLEIYQSKLLFQVFPSGSFTQSSIILSNNLWYQLIATYNSGTINYYINGVSGGTGSYSFTPSTSNLVLGRYQTGIYSLNGQLANVKFYNRALSATEIKQNFNATRDRYGV